MELLVGNQLGRFSVQTPDQNQLLTNHISGRTRRVQSQVPKTQNARAKVIMTQSGKDKLLHLMLRSLRGMCSNWLPQCPIKPAPGLSTVAINRSYKQPRNHNTRLAVIISVSQINYLTTSKTEMETKRLQLHQLECYGGILGKTALQWVRHKPTSFILFHRCAQVKQKSPATAVMSPLRFFDDTGFPPLTSDQQ